MFPFDLQVLWFVLIGLLFSIYACLDGFDLGVGMHLLRTKDDHERRIILNAVGPVWDGNEVWLLVGGGALFAGFPDVYATVFSGFYLPFMLLLLGLIFRAVAIEFRSKLDGRRWRSGWDIAFSIASYLIAILSGTALGNLVVGIPIGADREYAGGFFNLLTPYPLLVAVTTVALFSMHGAIYLAMKTEGELREKVRGWIKQSMIFFGVMFGILTMATFIFAPEMAAKIRETPALFFLPLVALLAIANVPRELAAGRDLMGFASSCLGIVSLLSLFGLGVFPNFLISSTDPAYSMTLRNSSASPKTLETMTIIAMIGVPFVLAYTIAIYRIFRGKVNPAHLHY